MLVELFDKEENLIRTVDIYKLDTRDIEVIKYGEKIFLMDHGEMSYVYRETYVEVIPI